MSSCHDVNKGPNEIQDKDQIQKEELDLILETLEGMTSKLNSSLREIKHAVSEVDKEVIYGNARISELADEIVTSIQNLQDKIISEIERKKEKCPSEDSLYSGAMEAGVDEGVMCENISFLCELDTKESTKVEVTTKVEVATKVEVIKEIRRKINDLDKTMEVKFKEVVSALLETFKNSEQHGDNHYKLRIHVLQKINEHEEFIRTNLLELI